MGVTSCHEISVRTFNGGTSFQLTCKSHSSFAICKKCLGFEPYFRMKLFAILLYSWSM